MFLSIITATYNRGYCLANIYNSLLSNEKELFEWIIVDDGSTDDTELLVSVWSRENKINITYVKQDNGGKTRAIINGFKNKPKGVYTLILDSDDYLVNGIIENLFQESKKLIENQIGMIGLKSDTNNKLIGTTFKSLSSNYIDLYYGKNRIFGDKLFIIRTDLYSNSFIAPFSDEKFVPDNIPYIITNRFGDLKCINIILYKGDYLEDGMTNNVLKMAARNINGFILEKKMLQTQALPFIEMVKNEIKYISYSLSARKSVTEIINQSDNFLVTLLLFCPAYIFTYQRIKHIRNLRNNNVG